MSDRDLHLEDHKTLLSHLDCSKEVAEVKMECVLLKERIREMKEDRDKAASQNRWMIGIIAGIMMTVAGSVIGYGSSIEVLKEKVTEIKKEVEKVAAYSHAHDD